MVDKILETTLSVTQYNPTALQTTPSKITIKLLSGLYMFKLSMMLSTCRTSHPIEQTQSAAAADLLEGYKRARSGDGTVD